MASLPTTSVRGTRGAVAAADQSATIAGIRVLAAGGNAVDAAIATNAVMAVVAPHLCGMGGDLFALVSTPDGVIALNASGRAGSGASAEALRADGHTEMPFRHDIRTVTVPGCVDGWVALHARFGTMPLEDLLASAMQLAGEGFTVSPLLSGSLRSLDERGAASLESLAGATRTGVRMTRPGVARTLRAVASVGRTGFYEGEFGHGLLQLGDGWYTEADLERSQADWVAPLSTEAFGVELHTIPPNTQGYLTLAAARLATAIGLPDDTDDPAWAHILIECATAAGQDRPAVLHEGADGDALLAAIDGRVREIDRDRASSRWAPGLEGDTTYLCTVDGDGMGVSLIQSNAAGFGSWIAEPNTGINLQNRGLGFSLVAGHPAELAPGRRPPHTLSPALATRGGRLASVFGTMGGDAQPQILLQVAARLFHHGQSPDRAVRAARWVLSGPVTGFDTWTAPSGPIVDVEGHAPRTWLTDLAERGHTVRQVPAYSSAFGHAHTIVVEDDGVVAGAADPRAVVSSCAAL
jgi:gamma-glutamyltranspeptidase/glutathione hydrolase